MTHLTAEQALDRDRAVLGRDYGAAYHHACQHLWAVVSYWDRYETLFGTKERVEVLNFGSGQFWHAIQNMLFEHVLLGLCRLTDPPKTGKRYNLTLRRLLEMDPAKHKAALGHLVTRAERRADFARSWRNARIAHNDFEEITGPASGLLPATRNKVRRALIASHDVLRWIHSKHFDGDMYLWPLGNDDANVMMMVLADGNEARRLRLRAIEERDWQAAQMPAYLWLNSADNRRDRYNERKKLRIPKG